MSSGLAAYLLLLGRSSGQSGSDPDGWFSTDDVATTDPENLAVSHPDVFEAAVIAVPHPVWQERPLLLIQAKPGREPTKESVLDFLSTRIARWWLPDDVVFVESLPHTATGKLLKTELRARYHGHLAVSS